MSTTSNAIVPYSVPPRYSEILQEVKNTRIHSCRSDKTWFENSTLRSKVYHFIEANSRYYLKPLNVDMIVAKIWRVCIYTAPVALTQIAPEESYKKNEDAFVFVALSQGKGKIENFPSVKADIELFKGILEKPLNENHRLSLLCNLYEGCHSFVVEKRSNTSCVLYQSYLGRNDESRYTFDEFLMDEKKHVEWKPEKLVRCIRKVISEDVPLSKRFKNYNKLFFSPVNSSFLEWKTAKHPFIFIDSEPYSTQKKV